MTPRIGDMWTAWGESDLFCITTNSTLNKQGKLVMGAGIAKQAKERFTGIDAVLGHEIKRQPYDVYGLIVSAKWPAAKLAAFQTKVDWRKPSTVGILIISVNELCRWCATHPGRRVDLNFPGIGNGGLSRDSVLPIIERLPDSVNVWELKE